MSNMIRDLASSSVVTTRDFFAAEAMSAILNGMARAGTQPEPDDMKAVAQAAYMAADAMIEVRRETLALDPLRSAAPELLEALKGLLADIESLMGESDGVAGLHLNGDVAPWSELDEGGQFERLSSLSAAHAAIAKATGQEAR